MSVTPLGRRSATSAARGCPVSRFGVDARDARSALAQARGCGMPEGRPIYFALDTDPGPLSASQWKGVFAYLDGAAAVLGRDNVGIYGGRLAIDKALGPARRGGGGRPGAGQVGGGPTGAMSSNTSTTCRSAAARWTTTGR